VANYNSGGDRGLKETVGSVFASGMSQICEMMRRSATERRRGSRPVRYGSDDGCSKRCSYRASVQDRLGSKTKSDRGIRAGWSRSTMKACDGVQRDPMLARDLYRHRECRRGSAGPLV
jgi:hypothetical protein